MSAISKCTFFWKPNDCFGELSQRYKSAFVCDDDAFITAEDFVIFKKAQVFGDAKLAAKIIWGAYVHPSTHESMGREVKNFNQEVWDEHGFRTVVLANLCKFTQNKKLRETLMRTGDNVLVEINPYDKVWAIGFRKLDEMDNINRWAANKLGMALMYVRDLIRERLERGVEEPVVTSSELPEINVEAIVNAYMERVSKEYAIRLRQLRKG